MLRTKKNIPIYLQERRANTIPLEDYVPQGIHILQDDETLVDGLVKRWCHGTPGEG